MAKKKSSASNNKEAFTSIQILSAKAQSLWAKAKTRMHQGDAQESFTQIPLSDEQPKKIVNVDISAATIAKLTLTVCGVLIAGWVLFAIRDKLVILLLAFFIAIVMDNNVRWMERRGVPRGVAVLIIYILFLSVAIFLIASLIPIVASQLQDIARYINHSADAFIANPNIQLPLVSDGMNERLTEMAQTAFTQMGIKDRASALFQFGQNLSTVAQSSIGFAVQIAGSVFNFMVNLLLILTLAFFIQLEREKISDFTRSVLPRRYRGYFDTKAEAIYQKISQWFQGQLILCVSIGLLVFVALSIVGMPYAQTLALLAGFTEFIPYAGPLIGAFPAVIIALSQFGFVWAAVITIIYYVVQLCENNLLVPLIMKHAVGLSPISIMFGMLVGVSFPNTVHPVIGIILAVPATAVTTIFVQDFYAMRRKK